MSNITFFENSKKIANDFIQNIVFLDDKAYRGSDNENTDHDFDAFEISKVFAKENKICAVYKPEHDKDIDDFKLIADKADIVILDWQIVIKPSIAPGSEEDDAVDDPRGLYTKDIIKFILFDGEQTKNSLKLIIVYTGDYTILEEISKGIYKDVFESSDMFTLNLDTYSIQSPQVKVIVRAKEVKIAAASNRGKYEKFMINYDGLPSFILDEFAQMTSGLLSNFALMSLTTLRKNSSKILGLFSKQMDSAYLSHKALLPSQEDSEDLLIELFGDTVADLLFYNKANENIRNLIQKWINDNIIEEDIELLKKDGKKYSPIEKYNRKRELLVKLIDSKNKNVEKRYIEAFSEVAGLSKTKAEEYYKYISINNTLLFLNRSNENEQQKVDQFFSILTHHKSLFIPSNTIPKLTLGTVVRSTIHADNYYICIQQKCDSVRIKKDENRKFLFIPLAKSNNKFDILTPDGVKLKKVKDSFSIRTVKFVCTNDNGMIKAEKKADGKFVFTQIYDTEKDEQFEWILDLKDLHAQRIIIDYTSQLSRVGLDESEWHRQHLS